MPLTDQERDRLNRHHETFAARVEQIRADTRLSDDGKRHEIAKAYTATREAITAITGGVKARDEKRMATLRKQMFDVGSTDPSAVISYRDALDRAENANHTQALELLARAAATGDQMLSKAVLARAWHAVGENGPEAARWNDVLRRYAEHNPQMVDTINEAGQLANYLAAGPGHGGDVFATSLPVPQEFHGYAADDIERFAA